MKAYWNNNGTYESVAKKLHEMIPVSGPVTKPKSPKLEAYRKACCAYYDLFNNGGFNRRASIHSIFGLTKATIEFSSTAALFRVTEPVMDKIIISAAAEQGLAVELL